MSHPGLRSIARNTAFSSITRGVDIVSRLTYVIVVARILGPEFYGMLAYSQSWYLAFMPLAMFGLGQFVIREMGRGRTQGKQAVAISLTAGIIMATTAAVLCAGSAWILAPDTMTAIIISVFTFALLARAMNSWSEAVFVAFEASHFSMRLALIFRPAELVAAVTVLMLDGGILMLAVVHSISWCFQAVASVAIVRRKLMLVRFAPKLRQLLPMLSVAVTFFLLSAGTTWQMQGPLILFRNVVDDDALLGQFALVIQAIVVLGIGPHALAMSALPVLTRSAVRNDGKDLVWLSAVLRAVIICGSAAGLCGIVIGPWLFPFLFGASFVFAGQVVGFALWCVIPLSAMHSLLSALLARGQQVAALTSALIGAAVMTLALTSSVLPQGIYGAVIGLAAGYGTSAAIMLVLFIGNARSTSWR